MSTPPRLFGQLSPTEFLQDYWQQHPLLIRQAWPDLQPLMSGDDLAWLAGEEEAEARIVSGPHTTGQRWQLQHGPFTEADFANMGKRDWTLLVQDVDKHLPEFRTILEAFRFLPDWRIDDLMVSFAADGGSVGPHLDAYDVFLLQADGKREWSIGAPMVEAECLPDLDLRILQQLDVTEHWVLEPGDMLYLPAGVPHHGVAQGNCVTYSIGFRAPSTAELFNAWSHHLAAQLENGPRYQDPLQMKPSAAPWQLTAAHAAGLKRLLEPAFNHNETDFTLFLGCYLTEPKAWLKQQDTIQPCSIEQLYAQLGNGHGLERCSYSRLLLLEHAQQSWLCANGKAWPLNEQQQGLGELLGAKHQYFASVLQSHCQHNSNLQLLQELISNGIITWLTQVD